MRDKLNFGIALRREREMASWLRLVWLGEPIDYNDDRISINMIDRCRSAGPRAAGEERASQLLLWAYDEISEKIWLRRAGR